MTSPRTDSSAFVRTLCPALKTTGNIPKRYTRKQRRELQTAHRWNADRNIIGFGVGPKCTDNVPDYSKPSLVVFVVRKLAKSRLPKAHLIPKRVEAESLERRFTTDVVELGDIPVFQAGTLSPGTNAAHFTVGAGSITAAVARAATGQRLLLSCCHVFSPLDVAGLQVESPPDTSSTTFSNHVANVVEFEPLQPGGNVPNRIDAALASAIPGAPLLSNDIQGVGRIVSASALQNGQFIPSGIRAVVGIGAVTGRVDGSLLAENVASLMRDQFGRTFLFDSLVAYRPSPAPVEGDSGMPIVVNTAAGLELLGMHIGRGRIRNRQVSAAFFVPIAPVFSRFGIRLA